MIVHVHMQHGMQKLTLGNNCTMEMIIDCNCRSQVSIRVLPSRERKVSLRLQSFPSKDGKMEENIILMCIKHTVPLPHSLSLPFSFETHVFTGSLWRNWRSRSKIIFGPCTMLCTCSSWGYHNWGRPNNSTHPSDIFRKCCCKWSTPRSRTPRIQCFK